MQFHNVNSQFEQLTGTLHCLFQNCVTHCFVLHLYHRHRTTQKSFHYHFLLQSQDQYQYCNIRRGALTCPWGQVLLHGSD